MSDYLIVVEKTDSGFSAYSPDLPGCIATAKTKRDVESKIKEAIEFHLEGMRMDGIEIPLPSSYSFYSKSSKRKEEKIN